MRQEVAEGNRLIMVFEEAGIASEVLKLHLASNVSCGALGIEADWRLLGESVRTGTVARPRSDIGASREQAICMAKAESAVSGILGFVLRDSTGFGRRGRFKQEEADGDI